MVQRRFSRLHGVGRDDDGVDIDGAGIVSGQDSM